MLFVVVWKGIHSRSFANNWGQGFILLLPKATVLPGLDAGSDGVEPALSFCHSKPSDLVLHVLPDVWAHN